MKTENEKIESYYDDYVIRQAQVGINLRHRCIAKFAEDFCHLGSQTKLLEIGCGVGTATTLFAEIVTEGKIVAVDISPKSIEVARDALKFKKNVDFVVSDMSDFESDIAFDLIIMPDVIEHIPLDQHASIFEKLEHLLVPGGQIFIHIPDPDYLDYLRRDRPELLQVVDQSLRFEDLKRSWENVQFDVIHWERYSIFNKPYDYRRIVLEKKSGEAPDFKSVPESIFSKFKRKLGKVLCLR